ncbi:MAG: DUF418 domain-containing protein [Gammaproteobacteria bacterium]|nr:DUF418 domain-containing protein [Gammaproteobacteria bacterium]
MQNRVMGFDLARALAIFGMVIVNFKIAMNAKTGNDFLIWLSALFEGRASSLFVILAGVGVTFLTQKARQSSDITVINKSRLSLIKRALLLIAIGLMYTPIWEADILHFYGFYFLIAAAVFMVSNRALLLISIMITLLFPVLMLLVNYDQNWNWATLTYQNLWSFDGMARHILFNGFHPVFPWTAFLVFGMWLGRLDLCKSAIRNQLLLWSVITLITTELGFYLLRITIGDGIEFGLSREDILSLFSTSMIPPMPQYIISAGSSACVVLVGSLYFSDKFQESKINIWLCQTGKLSLTLYVAHVILGMGVLDVINRLNNQSINFSLLSSLIFCMCGVVFSVFWLNFFKVGPLEWLFRKISS